MIRPDLWLGGILGKPAYRLIVGDEPAIDGRFVEHAAVCRLRREPTFMFAKVPVDLPVGGRCLSELGFHLVDTNVTFEKPLVAAPRAECDGSVRLAGQQDEECVARLAGDSFEYTRFHFDPLIPNALADRVKAEWVRSYFGGRRGDDMVLATVDGTPAGFTLLLADGDVLTIDLIAVDRSQRRRGLARRMIACAEGYASRGFRRLRVGTQLANLPSIRLYEGLGFRLAQASYVFHSHSD